MNLLQKLTELMRENGDTVASLSRKSGIPYTTIDGLFKKGFSGARISTIQAISKTYGVSLDYLIRDEITDKEYGLYDPHHDLSDDSEYHPTVPRTLEARIVSFGMDQLPQAEREKILSILQTMYNNNPDIFKRGNDDET